MFCVPNTTLTAVVAGEARFRSGCGRGLCAPNGFSCVCDATHEHSSFLFQLQDCWDAKGLQAGILVATSLVCGFAALYCAYAAFTTRAEIRVVCLLAMMMNVNMIISNVSLYLEGFNGIVTVMFFSSAIFFGMTAIGKISWMFLRPSLRMSGQHQLARRSLIPTFIVPAAMFYAFMATEIPAYAAVHPYPENNDFLAFNRIMTGFFITAAVLPFLVCLAPLVYMLVLFERVFLTKSGSSNSRRDGGAGASSAEVAPQQPQQMHRLRTKALNDVLKRFTEMVGGLLLLNAMLCGYLAAFMLLYQQAPLQYLIFILFKMYGPLLAILLRFFIKRAQQSMSRRPHSERRRAGEEEEEDGSKTVKSAKSKELAMMSPSVVVSHVGTVDAGTAPS